MIPISNKLIAIQKNDNYTLTALRLNHYIYENTYKLEYQENEVPVQQFKHCV